MQIAEPPLILPTCINILLSRDGGRLHNKVRVKICFSKMNVFPRKLSNLVKYKYEL